MRNHRAGRCAFDARYAAALRNDDHGVLLFVDGTGEQADNTCRSTRLRGNRLVSFSLKSEIYVSS